ncbi:MAG: hypothetical protein QOI20_1128, partial [Acidimicrobiaceae bacterium]|nr:hypothetical protein [Acidimicrobiaceae bacterium]
MTAVESRPPVADDTAERVHAPEAGGLGGRHFWGEVRLSLLTLFVTYAALAGALRLWRANLRVPFIYGGDANSHAMLFKAVMEHGWYEANPNLGAPYGQHFHDFPMADNLHLVVGKVLGLFTHSYALVVNVYFLATFGLAALTALWVLRWLGMSRPVSLVMSVLFAILPYHFMRGETHLFLAAYYGVPLATYLLFKAVRGESLLGDVAARHGWRSLRV